MILPEAALLKVLLNQETYNKYRQHITIKDNKELQTLYSFLDKMMEEYQRDVTFDEYCLCVLSNVNTNSEVISAILTVIKDANVSIEIAESLLKQHKERSLAHNIALLAIDVTEGRKTLDDLQLAIAEHESDTPILTEDTFVTTNLEELYTEHVKKHGLRWRLKVLNKMLGSLRKGDFGFVFARPETGKTTFLASEMTHFANQLDEEDGPILWFNNEEEGNKVQIRIFQAALGLSFLDLFKDRAASSEEYQVLTKDKIKIIDSANITKTLVESYCKKHKPSVILFDQLDKVKGFTGDREDLRLGTIYQWARELAKEYCPVIAVSQADGTAEGKKWLTMDNVANAKTAKQAEADWILGIGATHQEGMEYVRHLHVSKNKLIGDEDSEPKMRHGKADVLLLPEIARYQD